MAPCGATCMWVCIILLMYSHLSVGRATHSSLTVFINQPAVFPCVTTSDSITWRVNGTNYNDLPPEIRSDLVTDQVMSAHIHLFTLTIPGRAEYNGTLILCVTGHPEVNENAILRVQGRLVSVGDLTIDSSTSSFTTSWSAPFSLDVTKVDPDIWYTVLIYNVTDQENPTTIPCTDCHNLTQTHYTFRPDHPSPCHQYTFTVIPFNGAGQGESSQPVAGRLLASVGHLQTMYNVPSIIVSWSAPLNCDIRYTVLIYNVTHEDNHTAVPCTNCHDLTQTNYIFSPDYPSPCHQYTFTVIPYNGAGQGESSQNVTGHTTVDNVFCMRSTVAAVPSPTLTSPTQEASNSDPTVAVAVVVSVVVLCLFMVVIIISVITLMHHYYKVPRKLVREDLPLQRNEAYATVVRVPMQRNEAYESAMRPANTDTHTCPDYELVQYCP